MKAYDDVGSLIRALDTAACRYVVLRNYEDLLTGGLLDDKHPDIDILTDDARAIVDALGATAAHSDTRYGDGVHYYINLAGKQVSLDLRSIGDGYYCRKWQADILERRSRSTGLFAEQSDNVDNQPATRHGLAIYTPDGVDSFYTLLYHALFQKPRMSGDYRLRLCDMARSQGIDATDFGDGEWVDLLESYMRLQGYQYTYCTDYHVPLYRRWHDRRLTGLDWRLWYMHLRYDTKIRCIDLAVKIKHALHL